MGRLVRLKAEEFRVDEGIEFIRILGRVIHSFGILGHQVCLEMSAQGISYNDQHKAPKPLLFPLSSLESVKMKRTASWTYFVPLFLVSLILYGILCVILPVMCMGPDPGPVLMLLAIIFAVWLFFAVPIVVLYLRSRRIHLSLTMKDGQNIALAIYIRRLSLGRRTRRIMAESCERTIDALCERSRGRIARAMSPSSNQVTPAISTLHQSTPSWFEDATVKGIIKLEAFQLAVDEDTGIVKVDGRLIRQHGSNDSALSLEITYEGLSCSNSSSCTPGKFSLSSLVYVVRETTVSPVYLVPSLIISLLLLVHLGLSLPICLVHPQILDEIMSRSIVSLVVWFLLAGPFVVLCVRSRRTRLTIKMKDISFAIYMGRLSSGLRVSRKMADSCVRTISTLSKLGRVQPPICAPG